MQEETVFIEATLVFLIEKDYVLLTLGKDFRFLLEEDYIYLSLKKGQDIGAGCLNGYGGKLKEGEALRWCAARELWEEAHVIALAEWFKKVAIVDFYNQQADGSFIAYKVHVYFLYKWIGDPQETREMYKPERFRHSSLPLGMMMPADEVWLKKPLLEGRKIQAIARYGPNQEFLLEEPIIKCVDYFPDD